MVEMLETEVSSARMISAIRWTFVWVSASRIALLLSLAPLHHAAEKGVFVGIGGGRH